MTTRKEEKGIFILQILSKFANCLNSNQVLNFE
jgi:hypothetical protein